MRRRSGGRERRDGRNSGNGGKLRRGGWQLLAATAGSGALCSFCTGCSTYSYVQYLVVVWKTEPGFTFSLGNPEAFLAQTEPMFSLDLEFPPLDVYRGCC